MQRGGGDGAEEGTGCCSFGQVQTARQDTDDVSGKHGQWVLEESSLARVLQFMGWLLSG